MTTEIGKIVKSDSHIHYVCHIYNEGDTKQVPAPLDYAFGTFVTMAPEGDATPSRRLVGVIYNTMLMNPDFGNMGPRLSPQSDLEIFAPDYLQEVATLVNILVLGWQVAENRYQQRIQTTTDCLLRSIQLLH